MGRSFLPLVLQRLALENVLDLNFQNERFFLRLFYFRSSIALKLAFGAYCTYLQYTDRRKNVFS